MSRSYKKHPGFVDRNPFMKRQANKKVRRTSGITNGKSYRKVSDPYSICDHKDVYSNRAIAIRELTKHYGRRVYQSWMK